MSLHEIPPNGRGIAALITTGILNHFDLQRLPLDSSDAIHLQVEAMKLAVIDVSRHLTDIDFMRIGYCQFLDPESDAK